MPPSCLIHFSLKRSSLGVEEPWLNISIIITGVFGGGEGGCSDSSGLVGFLAVAVALAPSSDFFGNGIRSFVSGVGFLGFEGLAVGLVVGSALLDWAARIVDVSRMSKSNGKIF